MSNILNVSREGKWTDSATTINQNFMVFEEELNSIDGDIQKCKGLFPSLDKLRQEYPNPAIGSWAYVGESLPAPIYVYRSNGWVNSGKTGGSSLDPSSTYANSEPLTGDAGTLYTMETKWIQTSNNGGSWQNVNNRIIKINPDTTAYIIRPVYLSFGEEGNLLGASTVDPYLTVFKKGSFVSASIISSSNITKNYTENILSWTIDGSFYTREVSGTIMNRMPIVGDELWVTIYFRSAANNDIKVCTTEFKFSN